MLQLPSYARSRAEQGKHNRLLPDGRKLGLMPLFFGRARIRISEKPPLHNCGILADAWEYLHFQQALMVFLLWEPTLLCPEPTGWHRHPGSGRYRINGDPDLEYVKGDGGVEGIKYAVIVTQKCAPIFKVERCKDCEARLGAIFPIGTQVWHVEAEGDYTKFLVYHYLDRSVVLNPVDILTVSIGTVIDRLTKCNLS
jgi:hypothetical protein